MRFQEVIQLYVPGRNIYAGKVGAILCFLPSLAIGITAIVCADKMALILGTK